MTKPTITNQSIKDYMGQLTKVKKDRRHKPRVGIDVNAIPLLADKERSHLSGLVIADFLKDLVNKGE